MRSVRCAWEMMGYWIRTCAFRGISGLCVVDGSAIPRMVSCNTNGPILALAWRAAELILASELRP